MTLSASFWTKIINLKILQLICSYKNADFEVKGKIQAAHICLSFKPHKVYWTFTSPNCPFWNHFEKIALNIIKTIKKQQSALCFQTMQSASVVYLTEVPIDLWGMTFSELVTMCVFSPNRTNSWGSFSSAVNYVTVQSPSVENRGQ